MLIIPQCRFCNADKTTCEIKQGLKRRLQQAGIKDRLRYSCGSWRHHLKYSIGDHIEFTFWVHDGERLIPEGTILSGIIRRIANKKPFYIVGITSEMFERIDQRHVHYRQIIDPLDDWDLDAPADVEYNAPVRENLVLRKVIQSVPIP